MRREIEAGRRFADHPNVMPVLDADPEWRWFTMPLADGTVAGRAREFRETGALRGLIKAVCEALRRPMRRVDRLRHQARNLLRTGAGERSDLYTSRVFAHDRQVFSAWLFKGPGYPRPMPVRALGKPGDQIVRLFSEPAELLILQHCREITPSVVSMMEAYACDLRNPRNYVIIDRS